VEEGGELVLFSPPQQLWLKEGIVLLIIIIVTEHTEEMARKTVTSFLNFVQVNFGSERVLSLFDIF